MVTTEKVVRSCVRHALAVRILQNEKLINYITHHRSYIIASLFYRLVKLVRRVVLTQLFFIFLKWLHHHM